MIYFEKEFKEADSVVIEYQGKKVYRGLKFQKKGHYTIAIRSAASNSKYLQSLVFHISNLNGAVLINNQQYSIPKVRFPQVILPAEEFIMEMKIEILLTDGSFTMCNGSDPLGTGQICRTLTMGSAMMISGLENGWYQINCNDFEYDDDFNDFVFEIKMERDGNVLNICTECEKTI